MCTVAGNVNLVQAPWKSVWRFPLKIKIELSYDPAIPLLRMCPKKMKTLIQKEVCTPMFVAALFTTAKTWKPHKCPSMGEWKKTWCIHIHIHTMEYYSATEKNEILPLATAWMDLEGIILSEIHQVEKKLQYDFTHMGITTLKINEQMKPNKKQSGQPRERGRGEGEMDKEGQLNGKGWNLDFGAEDTGVYSEVKI